MEQRVRICDIAEELGLSTATVSSVSTFPVWQGFSLPGIVPKSSVSLSMTTKNMKDTRWMIFSLLPP